ncbi:MAG TPA: hypothetical protein VH012_02285 [Acidimicrobiales bacterium]|jgi:hypothetical protein|nr:hypothetical protein [Acidimicrobiales bacterium]
MVSGSSDGERHKDLSIEQSTLRGDMALIRRYGEAHPEAWVELRYENEPTVRMVAVFAGGDVGLHEAALRQLVLHPDRLEVRASPWPQRRLEEIRAEIHEMATTGEPGLFGGWGTGRGKVNVHLRADGERVAARLQERYGAAVDLTVGFLHYPDCGFGDSLAPPFASPDRPRLEPLPQELSVTTDEPLEVASGANLASAIRFINEGPAEVVVRTNGHLTAVVIDPESKEAVGGYSGAQAMPLIRFSAPTGGSVEIPLLVGTASIVPGLGYAVPAGLWAIEISLALGDAGGHRTPPIPLNVTP